MYIIQREEIVLFEKFKFNRKVNRIIRSWEIPGCGDELVDKLALTVIMHISDSREHLSILRNKFVCTDSAILASIYICKIAEDERDYCTLIRGLLKRVFMSCNRLFCISFDDIDLMFQNRLKTFEELIFSANSLEAVYNEASFLFSCDIVYDKYVEFSNDTPLPIMDFEKQFVIHAETKMFLQSMNRLIDKLYVK